MSPARNRDVRAVEQKEREQLRSELPLIGGGAVPDWQGDSHIDVERGVAPEHRALVLEVDPY